MRSFRPLALALAVTLIASDLKSGAVSIPIQQASIPTIKLCDLLRFPAKFKNRVVRVRAVYSSWFEGSELMENCPDSHGGVWAYFPDEVYQRSKREIAESLEDVFFRYVLDKSGKSSSQFSDWQTELVLTGRLAFSKKKNYGIHGGYAYLFTVSTVEEMGVTRIHNPETGQATEYVSESSAERRARHAKEAEGVCESNSLALDKVLTEMKSPEETITLVGSLGTHERSADLNRRRLMTIRNYFVDCRGVSGDRVMVREGERNRFEGRVNVYRANELSKILLAAKEMNICLKPCTHAAEQRLEQTRR